MADPARSSAAIVDAGPAPGGTHDVGHDGADVVFTFSYVSWEAAAQRGWYMPEDRLARALPTHERARSVLVCDLARSLPAKLLRDWLTRPSAPFPVHASARLVRPVRLRRSYPAGVRGVERACAAYDRTVLQEVRRMGLRDPVVITANPLLAGFAEFAWARTVTFYATDDWLAYPPHRRWWPAYKESFARVRARGRRVAAVTQALLERIGPAGENAVVPNGLDRDEWVGAAAPPPWIRELPRPLLVYAGTLDSRLDVRALLALARELPDAAIVLVGPCVEPGHLAPLKTVGNVQIHAPLGRREITGLIRAADVGIVPHRDLPLTQAMSPLKLYEYLAAGLPVAATDLSPMRGVDPSVTLVGSARDFPGAVRAALARGRAPEHARAAFIERNSWDVRHAAILDLALG